VLAGDAIGTYGNGFGLPLDETKFFTSFTLGAMLLGYLAGLVAIPRLLSQQAYLAMSAVLGVLFALGALFTHGYVSVGLVAALGFANAMMWPAIFPLAIRGLGRFTETGSGVAGDGHRRRRGGLAGLCHPQAALRFPVGVRWPGRALLSVHPVLRPARPSRGQGAAPGARPAVS